MLLSQVCQVLAHSLGHVICCLMTSIDRLHLRERIRGTLRSTSHIAENFTPQSIGTGEHVGNDGVDDWQIGRARLFNGGKIRPAIPQINSRSLVHSRGPAGRLQ
jgi:hypothetical protein